MSTNTPHRPVSRIALKTFTESTSGVQLVAGTPTNPGPVSKIDIHGFAGSTSRLVVGTPTNSAFVDISLADTVNLSAVGSSVSTVLHASGTADASVVITNGRLTGTDSTSLVIDATVFADGATVRLHVTDNLQFHLSGAGYTGATLTQTTETLGSAVAQPVDHAHRDKWSHHDNDGSSRHDSDGRPHHYKHGPSYHGDGGQFDLAGFAGSVLGQLVVTFATGPGETLSGVGSSVLKIDATADLLGGKHLTFDRTIHTSEAFSSCRSYQDGSVATQHIAFDHFIGRTL